MKNHYHSDPTTPQAPLFQIGTGHLLRIVFWTFDHGVQQLLANDKLIATGKGPRHLRFVATQGGYIFEKQ
jgi:hypothetical protein